MKTRIVILLALAAIVTFSFAFTSVKSNHKAAKAQSANNQGSAPAGGFEMEDSL